VRRAGGSYFGELFMTSPIVLIIGTRPEGIKMLPVYFALKKAHIPVVICSTNQHSNLLDEVFDLFEVIPDFRLDIMKPAQDLFHITYEGLYKTKAVFLKVNPPLVLVQGDTTSSMSAALAAFYLGIPVGHVEAGLRTGDMHNPFPEEMNRHFIGMIAQYHFAPTPRAMANLVAEGVAQDSIFCTGNTVVDALYLIQRKIAMGAVSIDLELKTKVEQTRKAGKRIVLLTTHRRESFNGGIVSILRGVREFALAHPEVVIFYPFHPNPNVLDAIEQSMIAKTANVFMSNPLSYKELIYLLSNADLVATDSGGIQEEGVSLGKFVLILREKTERPEGIEEGLAALVGTNQTVIVQQLERFLALIAAQSFSPSSVYGTGEAAKNIAAIISQKRNNFSSVHKVEKEIQR